MSREIDEAERLKVCEEIALKMHAIGLGWNYDAIERLTRPELQSLKAIRELGRMPEPTPFERGVLDRYQNRRRRR
jgi:hypothetical protein